MPAATTRARLAPVRAEQLAPESFRAWDSSGHCLVARIVCGVCGEAFAGLVYGAWTSDAGAPHEGLGVRLHWAFGHSIKSTKSDPLVLEITALAQRLWREHKQRRGRWSTFVRSPRLRRRLAPSGSLSWLDDGDSQLVANRPDEAAVRCAVCAAVNAAPWDDLYAEAWRLSASLDTLRALWHNGTNVLAVRARPKA